MTDLRITAAIEAWPIAGTFRIARGAKSEAVVVVASVTRDGVTGRGECTPYARYSETPEGCRDAIIAAWHDLVVSPDPRATLQQTMPPGAARNALDCALWDWEAKHSGQPVAISVGLQAMPPLVTAYTLSLDAPEAMAQVAAQRAAYPLLKLKLDGAGDAARMAAVRAARPDARLIVDANEAWRESQLPALFAAAAAARIELIEQPLPAGSDAALASLRRPVPVCADESMHAAADVAALADRYDAINIKLDKTGGFTAALAAIAAARAHNLRVMVGCMVATSLAMAPALLLAHAAGDALGWVDLDGPLLLANDRTPGLHFDGAKLHAAPAELWG